MPTEREIEMLPEAPASMPSLIPLRPPAVQDSPSAPPGKEIKVEETSEAAVQDEPSKPSSSSTPPAAAATDTDSSTDDDDDDLQEYANIEHTRKNDVLCGRGVTTNRHPGNEKFRALVHANKELYVSSSKRDKMAISRSIVEAVRARKPPGRFLEKDADRNLWFDIGDKKAIEKTSQALRDGAAAYRKQLSDDMSDPNFLDAVFDEDGGGDHSKRDSEHRRTNSDPGHRRTSSGSTKRKSPSGEEKEWLKVVPSDEKEQKEALERMTNSPAGAASVPFRPDRRPVRREHKRGLSVGSLALSRMYSRDTPRGMPYPRQTPPTSPRGDPYHSSHSPYGYGHSPYPYHCPPTPTSPGMMRYSRSYSWDNEHHQPPPSPYHHHHHHHHHTQHHFHHNHSRPPPPPRSSSDPGSPAELHHPCGPPSPVSYGRKGVPPPPPGSPRKGPGGYHHPPHEGWGSPRPYGHSPMSPRTGHQYPHSPYQHPPPYHQQYYNDQHHHPHHYHHQNHGHHSPTRPGIPPLSPRSSDVPYVDEAQDMVVDERPEPEPPTLSIPTLSQDSAQDQQDIEGDQKPKSSGEKVKSDDDRPPPPKWYPSPQRASRSPTGYGKGSYHDGDGHQDDNPFAPPPSRLLRHEKARPEKELLSSPSQERERQEEKLPVSARSLLLPERLRGETALPPRDSGPAQAQEGPSARRSRENAMSSLEVSPEASFDDGGEDPGQCPPEEIRQSFTFINGQLLQNDTPVNVTSSTAASTTVTDIAMNPSLPLSNPSTSPDTPKAVTAVEKFPVELSGEPSLGKGLRTEADIEIDNTVANIDATMPEERADSPAASPLPEFYPTKDDDSMLVMDDDRGLSPLPFDGSGEMNDEPLIDLAELFFP